jgi:acetyltransferase-like isoleucine patch superfamily enzyme
MEEQNKMRLRNIWVHIRRLVTHKIEICRQGLWQVALTSQRVTILPGCIATSVDRISFGVDVLISHRAFLQGAGGIRFGNKIMVGPGVMFITTTHDIHTRLSLSAPIVVEDGVWIGAGAIILPGVTLNAGCVVAAGALVNKDVPVGMIVGGVPARMLSNPTCKVEDITYFQSPGWRGQF